MNNKEIRFASIDQKIELSQAQDFSLPYVAAEGHLLRDWPCLIIKENSRYIAFCALEIHSGFEDILWISTLSVVKDQQKKGLGTKLIQAAIDYAKEIQCQEVRTWAHEVYAKRVWVNVGFGLLSGAELKVSGNTQLLFLLR